MLSNDSQLELTIFEVDHFKAVNDQHGHSVGDLALREIATRCSALLGPGDLIARWGGGEFLLVHPVSSEIPIAHKAEALRRVIAAEPIGAAGVVSASFGVTRSWAATPSPACCNARTRPCTKPNAAGVIAWLHAE